MPKHPIRVTLLVLLAAAVQFISLELPGGTPWLLAPFVYLPLVLVLPLPWSIVAAALPMAVLLPLHGDPFSPALAVLEAAWLSVTRQRWRVSSTLQSLLYWAVLGLPLLGYFHFRLMAQPAGIVTVIAVTQVLNHVIAVVHSTFLLRHTPLADWLEQQSMARPRMREVVFQSVFVLAIVPLVIVSVGITMLVRAYCEREDRAVLGATVERSARQIGLFLEGHRAALLVLADVLSRQGADAGVLLDATRRAHPEFLTMLVADQEGRIVRVSSPQPANLLAFGPVSDREYFRYARDFDQPFISGVFRGRGFGRDIIMAISAPIHDAEGRFAGIVQASVEVHRFGREIAGFGGLKAADLIIADAGGRVIFADQDTGVPALANLRHFPQAALVAPGASEKRATFDAANKFGEKTRYTAWASSADFGAVVIAQRPLLAGLEGLSWVYLIVVISTAGIVVAATLVARSTNRRVAEPLEFFARSASGQAAMRTVAPIPAPNREAPYEIIMVFRAFSQLAVQLQGTYAILRKNNEDLDRRVAERTQEAEAARRDAEAASRSKSDFLAMTSHEIRTPLNAIIGLADSLAEGRQDPVAAQRLRTIRNSGLRLMGVVNDLLDLSRVEAGKLDLVPKPMDVAVLCDEVRELFALRAQQNGLDLRFELLPAGPLWLELDGARLRQVLINLVGNALKFTRTGGIQLRGEVVRESGELVHLRLAVIDTGPGIPEEMQARLFQPFVQLPGAAQSAMPGSGLGLSISRRLVTLFGGELAVTSVVGQGSEFYFTIPARRAAPQLPPVVPLAADAGGAAPLRVLAADDNVANQEVLRSMLERHCARLEIVDGAVTALAALAAGEFDAALIDLEMLDGDGFSVARAVRAGKAGEAARGCRLIAFSAYDREQVWARCAAAGFDDFVEKPIDRQALLRSLRPPLPASSVAAG